MNQQLHVPPLTNTNKILICLTAVLFLSSAVLETYLNINLIELLGLSLKGVISGKIFQIFTFPFLQHGLLSVVFNGLIVWFIGSDLELHWGQSFYRKFICLNVLTVAIVYLLLSYFFWGTSSEVPLLGFEGICYAILIGYALVFPERHLTFMFLFPMKALYFCLLLIAMEFYGTLMSPYSASSWVHLFAIGFSFLYLKFLSAQANGTNFFKKAKSKRPNLKIIKRDDDEPKYWH